MDLSLRKIFLAAICAVSLLFTACGGDNQSAEPKDDGKAKIGVITHLNVSETEYNELMKKLESMYRPRQASLSANYIYFDKMNDMILALDGKQVDIISTYQSVADYMLQTADDKQLLPAERTLTNSFCFAVRKGDTMLKNDLNKAIKEMENDGTLVNLSKKYIVELKNGAEPPAVEIPMIDGADTIKVAVTGDLPPFDMILADGTPAGYSTAVLAEVSKRINKNIELVSVDSNARATILTSKGADVVFWVSVPKDSNLLPANIDIPAEIDVSNSYYSDNIVHIGKK